MLPFFLLATAIVFLWARREYGDFAAVMAAALFTTLPNILAFSSIAYTDIVVASTQVALFFAFVEWLDNPTTWCALWLGLAAGLALASKATPLIFFPAAAVAILLGKWISTRTVVGENASPRLMVRHVVIVLALASLIVWATYGFAVQHVREGMNLSAESMPSFQHFPAPLARAARWLVATPAGASSRCGEGRRLRLGAEQVQARGLSVGPHQAWRTVVLLPRRRGRQVDHPASSLSGRRPDLVPYVRPAATMACHGSRLSRAGRSCWSPCR